VDVAAGSDKRGLRRWGRILLIPALAGLLAGFSVSYAFSPKYVSRSLVVVKDQRLSEDLVQPLIAQDLAERVVTMQQQILGQNRLQPMLERLALPKPGQNIDDVIDDVRTNMSIEAVRGLPQIGSERKKTHGRIGEAQAFYVDYEASNARDAQAICAGLTDLLLSENLKSRELSIKETTAFLNKEVDEVKRALEALDTQFLARTKGRAPGMLTLEHEIEKKAYADQLSKLNQAQAAAMMATDLEAAQLSEQMQLGFPADLPDSPIFPNRLLFAEGGLGAGLALGLGLLLRRRFRRATS
jgi:uncharacterized protein involved in exopolysaccharide biosynthesis